MKKVFSRDDLRMHYAKTTLARIGVPFDTGMRIESVKIVVEGAVKAQERRRLARLNNEVAA